MRTIIFVSPGRKFDIEEKRQVIADFVFRKASRSGKIFLKKSIQQKNEDWVDENGHGLKIRFDYDCPHHFELIPPTPNCLYHLGFSLMIANDLAGRLDVPPSVRTLLEHLVMEMVKTE